MRKALAITLTRVPASSCSWISSRAALVSFEGIATPRKTLNTTGKCRDRRLEGKDTLNMLHIDKNNDLHTKNGCRALEQAMFDILRVRGGPGVFLSEFNKLLSITIAGCIIAEMVLVPRISSACARRRISFQNLPSPYLGALIVTPGNYGSGTRFL